MTRQEEGILVPARPSNRRVIEQAERHGCTATREGDRIHLHTPSGVTVSVMPAGTHLGTSHEALRSLYAALGVTDYEFWAADRKPVGGAAGFTIPAVPYRPMGALVAAVGVIRQLLEDPDTTDEAMAVACRAAAAAGVGTDSEEWAAGFAEHADRIEAEVTAWAEEQEGITTMLQGLLNAGETAEPDEPGTQPEPERAPAARGASTRVLEYLIEVGSPRSLTQVQAELSLSRTQASQAGSYLVTIGAARRVKAGVYEAVAHRPHDATVGIEVSVAEEEPYPEPLASVHALPALPAPEVVQGAPEQERPAVPVSVDSIDDEVDIVLDLLFPAGMTLRAADVRKVVAWTEATKVLLREVRS